MKIGFNLLLWTGFVDDSMLPTIEKIKAAGYDGVELPIFGGAGDPDHYAAMGKHLDALGLGRTVTTVMPDEQHSCVSPDPASRAGATEHLKWAVDCSEALGAEVLMGPFHQPLGVFTGNGPTDDEKKWCAEVHHEIAEYAQPKGIKLAMEYLNRFECYYVTTMAQASEHVKRVNHPNFGTMYDTFHANIEEADPIGIIAPNIGVINHVHISENDRGTPGCGHIDFAAAIGALVKAGYDGWMTIEAFGRALPELAAATRVWRDLSPSPDYVFTEGIKVIRNNL
ncbi:sugar phosphate isomerase/epimerase [Planctomycetales bacterium ZRK34]|nr:sugar phosphate isomerase/epimerase [Planctomycetales bacterium ZRK34]